MWWLNAAAFRLLGDRDHLAIFVAAPALAIALFSFISAARWVLGRAMLLPAALAGGALLTHVVFECGANRLETFVVACEVASAAAYARFLSARSRGSLLLALFAAGIAPWFKQTGISVGIAIALHAAIVRPRRSPPDQNCRGAQSRERKAFLPPLLFVALLPTLAFSLLLVRTESLFAAAHAIVRFNRFYFAVGDASWSELARTVAAYRQWLVLLIPFAILAALGLVGDFCRPFNTARRPANSNRALLFVTFWFLLAFYLACVGVGRQSHHIMPVLPPLALLALVPLSFFFDPQAPLGRQFQHPRRLAIFLAFCAVCAWQTSASLTAAQSCWAAKPAWHATSRREPLPTERQGAWIRTNSAPSDPLYVWGWSPGTYRYSYRRCSTRFATLEKVAHLAPHADFIQEEALAALRADPPAIFVISETDWLGVTAEGHRDFSSWLRTNFEYLETIDGMRMYRRSPRPQRRRRPASEATRLRGDCWQAVRLPGRLGAHRQSPAR